LRIHRHLQDEDPANDAFDPDNPLPTKGLIKPDPTHGGQQHNPRAGPDCIGQLDRYGLQGEGRESDGNRVSSDTNEDGRQPGEAARFIERQRRHDVAQDGDGEVNHGHAWESRFITKALSQLGASVL